MKIKYYLGKYFFNKYFSTKPFSKYFGFDRGIPIDRYYIEKFLKENSNLIKGDVLEVAESKYTKIFGGENVKKSLVLHVSPAVKDADIIGNLQTGEGIPEELVDCFILTQTLPFIYDVKNAVKNAIKLLKPGGHLLVTVGGISQISRTDMDSWGHYWSFTDLSLRKLFEEVVPPENIEIKTYGNPKVAAAFIYGLAQHELTKKDFEYNDRDYQLSICAIVKR